MEETTELDLKHILKTLLAKKLFIIIMILFFGNAAFFSTYFLMTPKYTSYISMYVNNVKNVSDTRTDINDMQASARLVNSYISILESTTVLKKVANDSNLGYTTKEIKDMMATEVVPNTEIFRVNIENADPNHAAIIANAIADITPNELSKFVEASSVKVIDFATPAVEPSSPNIKINTAIGILLGFMLSIGIVLLREIFDVRIKTEEDLNKMFDLPVLGSIPEMD